jgi:hypothetical protein
MVISERNIPVKAIGIKQSWAHLITKGEKTIEVRSWKTDYRGDLLICATGTPALYKKEMEELEEEWGCRFLYGHAVCVVRLADVRPMREGDQDAACVDEIDPNDYAWILEDIRPIAPFRQKSGQKFFSVDDDLIRMSPFKLGDSVKVKEGARDEDFDVDIGGWQGRVFEVLYSEEDAFSLHIEWDSLTMKSMDVGLIEKCVKEGLDWEAMFLEPDVLQPADPRDTLEDVARTFDKIIAENPHIFGEE